MRVLRWIGGLFGGLWRFSRRSWVGVEEGLRPRSGASALFLFLFLVFFLFGLAFLLLGGDLNTLDNWVEAQGGWLSAVGDVLFRIVSGLILAVCALYVGLSLFARKEGEKLSIWGLIAAVAVGYFAWIGMTTSP